MKKKLFAEGLFDEEYKKPLPEFPQCIGIITSPTGAALQDMISVLTRRFPAIEIILVPVKVQGLGAAEEIAEAIHDLNAVKNIDVIIVGRGGGSLEDLWAFNEEIVARAIFVSKIPIISAVGHEIDFSISDFVADLRAPTPSAAAELVVREKNELVEIIRNYCYTMQQVMSSNVQTHIDNIKSLVNSYAFNTPLNTLQQSNQQVDELDRRLLQIMTHRISFVHQKTQSLHHRMQSVNPAAALKRGYSIVRKGKNIISSIEKLSKEDELAIEMYDGVAQTTVFSTTKKTQ